MIRTSSALTLLLVAHVSAFALLGGSASAKANPDQMESQIPSETTQLREDKGGERVHPWWERSSACEGKDGLCTIPDAPGRQAMVSRVMTRPDGETPPSAEYRRPADEVLFLPSQRPAVTGADPARVRFESGRADLSAQEKSALDQLIARFRTRPPVRLRLIGHTDPQRLAPATQQEFADNQALSEARAKQAAAYLTSVPALAGVPVETQGVADRDRITSCRLDPSGSGRDAAQHMAQNMAAYQACMAEDRRVEIQIWYPQKQPACQQVSGEKSSIPFRISVDGVPLSPADSANSADQVRCTDIALEQADIRVRFDGGSVVPALNVTASPSAAEVGERVVFTPYSNYAAFIGKAEVRVFEAGSSVRTPPLAVIDVAASADLPATWQVPPTLPASELVYVLRVYDSKDRFDETAPQSLRIVTRHLLAHQPDTAERERHVGYGENHLSVRNIPVRGGMITVDGKGLGTGATVWVLGRPVPLDADGKFAVRQVLPAGQRVVDVVTEAADGKRHEYHRPIHIPSRDWFYVGQADLTLGASSVRGPATLVTGQDGSGTTTGVWADGRLAYYVKGTVGGGWGLTSSGDTQEQPLEKMFSGLDDRNPRSLLRRLDPKSHYQVYGDDSTTLDDAPTRGKFFVALQKDDTRVMWGSFRTRSTGTDLADYSRTLYGASGEYRSPESTPFGERRTEATVFLADPGTLPALEEFRGTGGSLYYLRGQDIIVGSDRVRIEVRDRESGLVLETRPLVYGEDYDINYLQGRILLNQPLSSVSAANTVISTGALSGNPTYLVVGYEYTPTVSSVENFTRGGRISHWLNDYVRLGVSSYHQNSPGAHQELTGVDATVRYAPGTYLKLEGGRTEGPGSGAFASQNGGFNFSALPQTVTANPTANAYRAEVALDLAEITQGARSGTLGAYVLNREDGYSAPGALTNEGVQQSGVVGHLPLSTRLALDLKADQRDGTTTGQLDTGEASATYRVTPSNSVTLAVRGDDRETNLAAGNSAQLARTGGRVDAGVKVTHAPREKDGDIAPYEVYFLGQATLYRDGERPENNRVGVGGSYPLNDRVKLTGEVTEGSGGWGGKAGLDYQVTDRTSYYTTYLRDRDRSDTGYRGRNSSLVGGARTRYSDTLSAFTEHRYETFDQGPSGLIHAFGLDLAASDSWTWGARVETGTISDPASGDLERTAASLSTTYAEERVKYSGVLEWRQDTGTTLGDRTSWLMRNTVSYQTTPDWRFLGGLDFAISDSGLGGNYDADYTEFFLGYAYRPVKDDRLNLLMKYTYLADQASPGQQGSTWLSSAHDFQQKSHVFAVDGMYDVTPRLSVGGKVGYRYGALKDTTAPSPAWYDSAAWLLVARADWEVAHEWDMMGEWRYLTVSEAKDSRMGALAALYRHIDDNFRVGVGYNFTDFSDDLTDLDYTSQGVFLNVLGKF